MPIQNWNDIQVQQLAAARRKLGIGGGGVALSAGTSSQSTGTVQFVNSNGISFGLNNGSLTATMTPGAAAGIAAVGAGASSVTNGTLVFSNANQVSFGLNGSTMTASVPAFLTTAAASDHTHSQYQTTGNYLTTAAASDHSHSQYAGTNGAITGGSITVNTGGVSVNLPAYLTTAAASDHTHSQYQTTGNYLTTAAASDHTHSQYAGTAGAITGGSITVNTSGVSVDLPAYLTTAAASNHSHGISVAAGSFGFQTLTMANTNQISFYQTNGSLGASHALAGTNAAITGGSITVNTSGVSVNLPAYLTTAAASDHTHSQYQSTGAYLTTAAASDHTHSQYAGTAGAITGGSITVNTSGVSVNLPAYLTTAAASDHTHSQYQSTGAYLTTAAQVSHTHGNLALTNLTGTSASNGLSLSAADPGGHASNLGVLSISGGDLISGEPIIFIGSGAVSIYSGAGDDQIVWSVANSAATNHTHGNLALTNLTGTSASNGLSLSAAAPGAAAGIAGIAGSAASTVTNGTVVFQTGNGITFGLNGSTITASHNALTNNLRGFSLSAADLGGTANGTGSLATSGTLAIRAGTNIQLDYFSTGGPELLIQADVGIRGIADSAGSTLGNGTVVFQTGNGITFGLNASTMTASHNGLTTAAASDHSHGNPTLALTNLSGTTASASNGFTLSLAAAAAGAAPTLSNWPDELHYGWVNTAVIYTGSSNTTGGSTQFTASGRLYRLALPYNLVFNDLDAMISAGASSAGTGSATLGVMMGFYTLNANSALSLLSSFHWGMVVSQNSTSARSHTWWCGTNSTNSSSYTSGNISASMSGMRIIELYGAGAPSLTLNAGDYYVGWMMTQRSSSVNVYAIVSHPIFTASQTTKASYMGRSDLTQVGQSGWHGIFSTTTNTNVIIGGLYMPGSIHTSNITQTGGTSQWLKPYWYAARRNT